MPLTATTGVARYLPSTALATLLRSALNGEGQVMAPLLTLLAWAVIPFAAPLATRWGVVDMILADLPIGILYVLALTSLGVYGIFLGDNGVFTPRPTPTPRPTAAPTVSAASTTGSGRNAGISPVTCMIVGSVVIA